MREKRRPTLEELKELPEAAWRMEAIQTKCDAEDAELWEIAREAESLFFNALITPEKVVELREKFECATAETVEHAVEHAIA